ncbi:unnamed protein product [Sphenostylis stenocarpa]|uniref:Uncharacterized protein n=1 Tax=Sphenostylis stenocarpa TaxID=92480 RepID=A0AA86W652_9FABA|nr:unnamed protein product [Sphenostylis stenocarpa]
MPTLFKFRERHKNKIESVNDLVPKLVKEIFLCDEARTVQWRTRLQVKPQLPKERK